MVKLIPLILDDFHQRNVESEVFLLHGYITEISLLSGKDGWEEGGVRALPAFPIVVSPCPLWGWSKTWQDLRSPDHLREWSKCPPQFLERDPSSSFLATHLTTAAGPGMVEEAV